MKQKLLKLMLLLVVSMMGVSAWGEDIVVTLDNIGASLTSTANTTAATTDITATGTTDSYTLNYYQCKKQSSSGSYAMLMTRSSDAYISNKTAMPGNIKSVEVFIMSGAAGKTTYDCAFSTTEVTSATSGVGAQNITGGNSHTFSSLSVDGKFFCITLGNANNGQVLKLVITCEEPAATPNDGVASIALSGTYTTEFDQGGTFNHDGVTVTATLGNGTEVNVTSDAVFTTPDMSTPGSKTVTVSYTDTYGTTKTTKYSITVNFAITDGVFDFVTAGNASKDYGSGITTTSNSSTYVKDNATWTAGNVTMVTSVSSGNGYRWWSADNTLRFYNGSGATFSVPEGYVITKIVTTGANFDNASVGTLNSTTWNGLSREVTLSATATRNIQTITVTYINATYSRTTTAGSYGTICLPYDATVTGATLYTIAGKDSDTPKSITLADAASITAGVPYIFKATGSELVATYTSGTYTAATSANGLHGTYDAIAAGGLASADGSIYMLSNNTIQAVNIENCSLGANRAYIVMGDVPVAGAGVKGIRLYFDGTEEATAITGLTEQTEATGAIYNLNGQRVNSLQRGINIVNGKKVLVK